MTDRAAGSEALPRGGWPWPKDAVLCPALLLVSPAGRENTAPLLKPPQCHLDPDQAGWAQSPDQGM